MLKSDNKVMFNEGTVFMYRNKISIPALPMADDIKTMGLSNSATFIAM